MEYKLQQIVWAKMVGFPYWPAVIIDEMEVDIEKPSAKNSDTVLFPVHFLGDNTTAWLNQRNICDYEKNKLKYCKHSKTRLFLKAIDEADHHLQNQKEDSEYEIRFNISKKRKRSPEIKSSSEKKSPIKIDKVSACVADQDTAFDLDTTKIGVIGIGFVGEEITKHFIRSVHTVNIYNRTYTKCEKLKKDLKRCKRLKLFNTPKDVLLESDIIFMCLSDDEVTQEIIESEFEAISKTENILQDKGILVMSKIKPESSIIISEKIKSKRGKYLELAFQGNREDIRERSITLITAGDISLFNLCQPYFKAISKASYFFGTAGNGLKMNMILQTMKAINLGALAEGMSLTQRLGIPLEIFFDIFVGTDINSTFLRNNAMSIIGESFKSVEQPLQQMMTELRNILDISYELDHSVPLANMAHELYKECKRLRFGSFDVSAVYLKYKNY